MEISAHRALLAGALLAAAGGAWAAEQSQDEVTGDAPPTNQSGSTLDLHGSDRGSDQDRDAVTGGAATGSPGSAGYPGTGTWGPGAGDRAGQFEGSPTGGPPPPEAARRDAPGDTGVSSTPDSGSGEDEAEFGPSSGAGERGGGGTLPGPTTPTPTPR